MEVRNGEAVGGRKRDAATCRIESNGFGWFVVFSGGVVSCLGFYYGNKGFEPPRLCVKRSAA